MKLSKLLFVLLLISTLLSFKTDNSKYLDFLNKIKSRQNDLSLEFLNANNQKRDSIIVVTRQFLEYEINENLWTFWYGTKWSFSGMTREPKKGSIACGYFITNILTDVGFKIPRIYWAQKESGYMIKKLTDNKSKVFINKPIEIIENYIKTNRKGIYIVGLDNHTGFITYWNKEISFIHSNYYNPEIGVMEQDIADYSPLLNSKYRLIGKLFDDQMVINWLTMKEYN